MRFIHFHLLGQLAGLSIAHPTKTLVATTTQDSTRLSNTPLSKDLNYLKDDLNAHLPATNATAVQWGPGWLPQDCQTQMVARYNLSTSDIAVYNVTFGDCSAPWIICHHRNSPQSVEELILDFSRIPVRARSYVKHLMSAPDNSKIGNNYAYNYGGSLMMVNEFSFSGMMHETGHSLDFQGAYPQYPKSFSESQLWRDAVGKDSNVPDDYAGKNYMEDLAQSTVVAAFDLNVPGGLRGLQKDWQRIENQYTMVQQQLGVMLAPGGFCSHRLANSVPVPVACTNSTSCTSYGTQRRAEGRTPPDVSLPEGIVEIEPVEYSTEEACRQTW